MVVKKKQKKKVVVQEDEEIEEGEFLDDVEGEVEEEAVVEEEDQVPEIEQRDEVQEELQILSSRIDQHHRVIVQLQKYIIEQHKDIKILKDNFKLLIEEEK